MTPELRRDDKGTARLRGAADAAVVETPRRYDQLMKPWTRERFDLNMTAASQIVKNVWKEARVTPDQLLTTPSCWATVDYLTVESPDVSGEMTFQVARPGTGHGFVLWFLPGISLLQVGGSLVDVTGSAVASVFVAVLANAYLSRLQGRQSARMRPSPYLAPLRLHG